jgi:hypothetical protein
VEHAAYPPISPDALLSDCHSAVLVSWGRLDRLVLPSPVRRRPGFARLLDWANGGHFRVDDRFLPS